MRTSRGLPTRRSRRWAAAPVPQRQWIAIWKSITLQPGLYRIALQAGDGIRQSTIYVFHSWAQVDRSKDTLFFASDQSLSYLDGSLPADFGFDPLGLSDPEGAGGFIDPKWLAYR